MTAKFIIAALPLLLLGVWVVVIYSQSTRESFMLMRAFSIYAAIAGLIGLALPKVAWPWLHIVAPSVIFAVLFVILSMTAWKTKHHIHRT